MRKRKGKMFIAHDDRVAKIYRYSEYLFDLVEDLSAVDMNGDIPAQTQKLKDRAVYLLYCMNMEEKS